MVVVEGRGFFDFCSWLGLGVTVGVGEGWVFGEIVYIFCRYLEGVVGIWGCRILF